MGLVHLIALTVCVAVQEHLPERKTFLRGRTMIHDTAQRERLLLSMREAARMLGCSERHLWAHSVGAGTGGIPYVRIGRLVKFAPADLQAWIESQRRS